MHRINRLIDTYRVECDRALTEHQMCRQWHGGRVTTMVAPDIR